MKKSLRLLCILAVISLLLTGCDSADYKKAMSLYEDGAYSEACQMFVDLGDYENSAEMVLACNYEMALEAMDAGDFDLAEECLIKAGDYADAPALMEQLPGKKLIHYLSENGELTYQNPDPAYTVSLYAADDNTLVMHYLIAISNSSSDLREDVTIKLVLGETNAQVSGTSYMSVTFGGKSENNERVAGTLDIQTYRYGDEMFWEDYEFKGHDIYGNPLDYTVSGLLYVASNAPLERTFRGVEEILAEHNLGITLIDLGFASIEK